mmetsp:Transcript_42385/g.90523  ORF Transcript_42385/g.90523 Transcript_42385/m.90523 type:complete len:285 (+) Transcript_42385:89-943(+)
MHCNYNSHSTLVLVHFLSPHACTILGYTPWNLPLTTRALAAGVWTSAALTFHLFAREVSASNEASREETRRRVTRRRVDGGVSEKTLALAQRLHEHIEVVDEPVGPSRDLVANNHPAKADKGVGTSRHVTCLHIGSPVADHHDRLEAVLRLEVGDDLRLAALARRGLVLVVPSEGARIVEEQIVREYVSSSNANGCSNRLDHLPEAARDEKDALAARLERRDEGRHTRRQHLARRVRGQHLLHLLPARLHHLEPVGESDMEWHIASHRLLGEFGDLLADTEECG